MPEELFRRAAKYAEEAAEGAPTDSAPTITHESHTAKTEQVPLWSKTGWIFKDHFVEGLAGEPILRDNRTSSRYSLHLNGNEIVLEHTPFGWVDLEDGRRALFTLHPHGNGELSIVVHGIVDEVDPKVVRKVQYGQIKHLPGMAGESTVKMEREVTRHWVKPLSKDEISAVEAKILTLLQRDLASVFSRRKDERYWKAIEAASQEFAEIFQPFSGTNRRANREIGDTDTYRPTDFTKVQRIIANLSGGGGSDLDEYALSKSVADFQRVLLWRLRRSGQLRDSEQKQRGERVATVKQAVVSKGAADLKEWSAYPRVIRTHLRYLKTLQDAISRGRLHVRFVHRVG